MSGQSGQSTPGRMQKSSPNSGKQGPIRATIPISSVLKQNSNLISDASPNISPTCNWKTRYSPDPAFGQRSPGSSSCKGKSKQEHHGEGKMRRTASLDTIYLKGHWPRDNFYWHTGILQVNKSTQTDESDYMEGRKIHCISESGDKPDKVITRQKLRDSKSSSRLGSPDTLNTSSQTFTSSILSPTLRANPMHMMPLKPLPKSAMRSSVEGLNQEIERIVLQQQHRTCAVGSQSTSTALTGDHDDEERCRDLKTAHGAPEGHRAPPPEMMYRGSRSRSVNTQTPNEFSGGSCHSSGSSAGSSPDNDTAKLGTSPHINRFLAREPPDGCEKVQLKTLDDRAAARPAQQPHHPYHERPMLIASPPQQPCTAFKLRPSLGSAFQILRPTSVEQQQQQEPPTPPVPSSQENN